MRLKLTLEYDGTDFHGWAAQPGLRTVEGVLREGLDAVYPQLTALAVAGRTDTGVHAFANVVSADVDGGPPVERATEAVNASLPGDLAVVSAEEAAQEFHARHSARSRSYRYRVWRRPAPSPFEQRRAWWYPRPLDEERLADSADLLLGEHDFQAFTPTETQHQVFVRNVLSRSVASARRRARARDHRRQLPAPHGAHARRDDARAAARADRAAAGGAPEERGRLDRPTWGLYLGARRLLRERG